MLTYLIFFLKLITVLFLIGIAVRMLFFANPRVADWNTFRMQLMVICIILTVIMLES